MSRARSLVKLLLKFNLGKLFTTSNFTYLSRQPISHNFGVDLGTALDRYYIEKFLYQNSDCIKGICLEVAESTYTKKFGTDKVTQADILHIDSEFNDATIIGDLSTGKGIPETRFDCMILTQTFQFIYDYQQAIINSYKALTKNGVLLSTFPGISQIARYDMDNWGEYWRFTNLSAKMIFENVFGEGNVEISVYGNVKTACAFLQGIPLECMRKRDLKYFDRNFEVIIGVKAIKR